MWTASRLVNTVGLLVVLTLGDRGGVGALSPVPNWGEQGYPWPIGTYAVPAAEAGQCPGSGYEQEDWHMGQLLQSVAQEWSEGARAVDRGPQPGGKESTDVGGAYMLTLAREQGRTSFCAKTVHGEFSPFEFMPGRYCLWKRHRCPVGFEEGWIRLNSQPSTVMSSGTLPDGSYDNLTVVMGFCCRDDGIPTVPIRLPDVKPFALLRLGHSACQTVQNMDSSDGWTSWEGLPTVSDGLYPEMDVEGEDLELAAATNRTRIWTCVYRPRSCSGRCLAVFLDVFFVCFIVGVLVLGIFIQLRKRCGRRGASPGISSSSSKLHFFYRDDSGEEDSEEGSIGYEPLLPFYQRRRCPVGRDASLHQPMQGGDSRAAASAVLVARVPSLQSTDDDVGEADDDEEDVAWDVTVFVQLPQQATRHHGAVRSGDARSAAPAVTDVEATVARSSPPPPYEETAGEIEPPASVTGEEDALLPEQEPTERHQQQ